MPLKGQCLPRKDVVCPCGNVRRVSINNTKRKYCSFACYVKYTPGYDHKALGYRHDAETKAYISELAKMRPLSDVHRAAYDKRKLRPRTEAELQAVKNRTGVKVGPMSEERKKNISESRIGMGWGGAQNYRGGRTGEEFAQILCPLGYVREYVWKWGSTNRDCFHLDFAHPEIKVNIELDGPGHDPSNDKQRDEILRHFGWRVIRVRHDA